MAGPEDDSAVMAAAVPRQRFATLLRVTGGEIRADEPAGVGGVGTGPTPYELLSAALAACTSMTLRLYAGRKGWSLPDIRIEVAHALVPGAPARDRFTRRILFAEPVDADTEARLLEMADRCPVHRTLSGGGSDVVTLAATVPRRPPRSAPRIRPKSISPRWSARPNFNLFMGCRVQPSLSFEAANYLILHGPHPPLRPPRPAGSFLPPARTAPPRTPLARRGFPCPDQPRATPARRFTPALRG
jgi:uncharacterized OsmC-like protein